MNVPLSARLRAATHTLHTEVERSGLMQQLLRGRATRPAYGRLLRSLHPVYDALETGLTRHAADPSLAPVCLPGLARRSALAQDLTQLAGADWAARIPPAPPALAYAAHLRDLGHAQPGLLAAHAYVRYLGDLSGGQALARRVAMGLGLAPGEAVAFYDFGDAQATARLTAALRAGLDQVAADEAAAQALVDEAVAAFERHRELFNALDDSG